MSDLPGGRNDLPTSGVRRRLVLGSGAAAAFLVAVGAPTTASGATASAAAAADGSAAGGPLGARGSAPAGRAHAFLDAAMDAYPAHGSTRLAQSYTDQAGLFSTAFTYDNALAVLAHLADGRHESLRRARVLGDALLFAQDHDPQYADGRLRQAYNVGPYVFYDGVPQPDGFVRADGMANIGSQFGFVGTAVGDMAWAGIGLAALARRTCDQGYLTAAVRIGEWIHANTYSTQSLGGYTFGVDGANIALPFSSAEHNIDLIAFFGQLARLTGDRTWRGRRAHALAFVRRMWEPAGGFFYTGTNDGTAINTFPIPADTQTWSYLAIESRRYAASLDWEKTNLFVVDTAERVNSTLTTGQSFEGVTFSSASLVANESEPIAAFQPRPDRFGVWFEGSGHLALALTQRRSPGDGALARQLLDSTERAQDQLGGGQTMGGLTLPDRAGVVSASSPLDTGFGFGYYPYRHIGATAWYLLAVARSNPLAS